MSANDPIRWVVMLNIGDRTPSRAKAGVLLRLGYWCVKRLFQFLRTSGQKGLMHGNARRRPSWAHARTVRAEAVAVIAKQLNGIM